MTKKCDLRVLTVTSVTNVPKAHESEGRLDRLEVEGLLATIVAAVIASLAPNVRTLRTRHTGR